MANKREEYRIQRGELLRMLYRMYPDAVGDNVIKSTFIWITPGVIEGHVAYLIEDGYVSKEPIDHKKYEFSTADYLLKITPKGIDLLEGNVDADPGIQNPPL